MLRTITIEIIKKREYVHGANTRRKWRWWRAIVVHTKHLLRKQSSKPTSQPSKPFSEPANEQPASRHSNENPSARVYMTVYFSCYFIDNVRGVVALKSQSRTIELSMCYATKFYLVGHVPPIHDSYRICFVRCVMRERAREVATLFVCQHTQLRHIQAAMLTQPLEQQQAAKTNEALARRQKHIVTDIFVVVVVRAAHSTYIFVPHVCVCVTRVRDLVCMHGLAFALVSMIPTQRVYHTYICLWERKRPDSYVLYSNWWLEHFSNCVVVCSMCACMGLFWR